MAWIRIRECGDGELPALDSLHGRSADSGSGEVDEILRVHSLHPRGWEAHLTLYQAVMRGTRGLPRVEREMIALIVSRENGCHY